MNRAFLCYKCENRPRLARGSFAESLFPIIGSAGRARNAQRALQRCNAVISNNYLFWVVMLTGDESFAQASPEEVRTALERVLASPGFASKRRGELLRYLVERTLAGEGSALSEYSIALDV